LRRRTIDPNLSLPSIHDASRFQVQRTTLAVPNANFDMPYNFSNTTRNLPLSVLFKREQTLDQAKLQPQVKNNFLITDPEPRSKEHLAAQIAQLELERKTNRIETLKRIGNTKQEFKFQLAAQIAEKMTPFKAEKKKLKPVVLSPRPKMKSSWQPISDYLDNQNLTVNAEKLA